MAIGATAKWEVRTTGVATNGGFYTSGGTDYSQQNAAQYALTGATTVAANAIILHASAAADMVGNGLYVVSGTNFIVGWYEVISVVAGVSITVDRNCTTGIGALGVINVGGAVDHPNTISAVVVAGNTIYIQNGTYLKVGANAYVLNTITTGGAGTPIRWIGYITNHTTIPTGANRPVLSGGNNTTNVVLTDAGAEGNSFENLVFYDATGDGFAMGASCSGNLLKNCRSYSHGSDGAAIEADIIILDCEFDNNSAKGINEISNGNAWVIGSYVHDNTTSGIGFSNTTANINILSCIADSNSGGGFISVGATSSYRSFNSLAYNNTGAASEGFLFDDATLLYNQVMLLNNSSVDNGRYGFASDNAVTAYNYTFDYNNYNGNGTAGLNNITAGLNDNTTAPAFTNAAGGDFTITSADTALKGTGFPQTIQGATGDYQWNIGIDQGDHSAGGGGWFSGE